MLRGSLHLRGTVVRVVLRGDLHLRGTVVRMVLLRKRLFRRILRSEEAVTRVLRCGGVPVQHLVRLPMDGRIQTAERAA